MKKLKNMISKTYKELHELKQVPITEQNIDYDLEYNEVQTYFSELLDVLFQTGNPNLPKDKVFNKLRYL